MVWRKRCQSTIYCVYKCGCFRKWGYPQIIHFTKVFHYKTSILGYPYFWKHPSRQMNKNRFEHVGSHVSCSHAVTFLHVRMYVPSVFTCIHRQGSKLTGVLNSSCADSGHHFLNITHKTIVLSSNFNVQSHRNYFLNVAY